MVVPRPGSRRPDSDALTPPVRGTTARRQTSRRRGGPPNHPRAQPENPPGKRPMDHDDIKQKLIIAGKVLVAEGQDEFTRGHISMRLPDNALLFFMKPHSVGLDEITMDNI